MISFWHLAWIVPVSALFGYVLCGIFAWRDSVEMEIELGEKFNPPIDVRLDPGALMPTRAYESDAGLDIYCRDESVTIEPGDSYTFGTGVHMGIPLGCYGKVESKSGLNVKHGIVALGGVIDNGYTGEIAIKLYNQGKEPYTFTYGSKLAQIVIQPVIGFMPRQVGELDSDSGRGDNGFGSTGY